MAKKDPRVDDYIKRAAPFARPILKHLRKIVHVGCPDVEETIKWQSPFFERKGIICFMAAFKQHCVFGFWKGSLIFGGKHKGAMRHFGRITSMHDLPNQKMLIGFVRRAAELNEAGTRKSRPRPRAKREINVPADLKAALQKKVKARKRQPERCPKKNCRRTKRALPAIGSSIHVRFRSRAWTTEAHGAAGVVHVQASGSNPFR